MELQEAQAEDAADDRAAGHHDDRPAGHDDDGSSGDDDNDSSGDDDNNRGAASSTHTRADSPERAGACTHRSGVLPFVRRGDQSRRPLLPHLRTDSVLVWMDLGETDDTRDRPGTQGPLPH